MAMSETGTSTSNTLGREYDVFLNFRGPDTRRGFADVLHSDLSEAGIHVFIDDEEIRPGERIDGELLRAINDSRLYIPIFSPRYASSYWCLCELAKMVENISNSGEEENKKVILPIFYKVKPDDVKLRTLLYENDIQKLEQTMKDKKKNFSSEDANTWRRALKTVGGISGLDLKNYPGDGHLSKSVVDEVVNRLQTRQREVTEDLVGMENRISAINNLLDIDVSDVRLIGIYGMGGMGKTTLAQIIYNQLCPHFGKSCSFLRDVRETAKTVGLVKLQEQLLSDISNSTVARNIHYDDDGIKAIEGTICSKKVLVVLDDVDDGNQIRKLIGRTSLYPGTRILVTTRDSGVLNIRGLKYKFRPYELERLSNEHALQLFSKHAFDVDSPLEGYDALSKDIVHTAGGLPLALQAIGASLFGQEDKHIWKEMLQELRRKPHDDVLGKLKITYDALTLRQQNIFLDIACFFINKKKTNPSFVWADCEFGPKSAIDVLSKRCMIKVLDNDKFWMHDQFRDLGRAIAKEGHTRLRYRDNDISKVRPKEEDCVQALHVQGEVMTITAEEIKRFPNLQFLWLNDLILQGDFAGCLLNLKWFSLRGCGTHDHQFPSMPTNLHLKNVVVLHTRFYEWREDAVKSLIKEATKLKVLIIELCHLTHETPTFSEHLVLEKLRFDACSSLEKISCSIGKLRLLTHLNFKSCGQLEKLPEQIGELKNLRHLSLKTCWNLRELPDSVSKLESLTTLDLDGCKKILKLPELPINLTTLRVISESLQTVPDISNLTDLVELHLSNVTYSGGLDGSFFRYWSGSKNIQPCDLPSLGRLSKLRKQTLHLFNVCATSTEWGSLSNLEELDLYALDLQALKQLPANLRVLRLEFTRVKQVELDGLSKLRDVLVSKCSKLVEVQFHGVLKSMESLHIDYCYSLERLVCLSEEEPGCNELQASELTDGRRRVSLISSSLKMLRSLRLSNCHKMQEIHFVSTLEALDSFSVEYCISLKRLGGLSNLKNLNYLLIQSCENLHVVEGTDKLEHLELLHIYECRSMERIVKASSSKIPKDKEIILNAQTQAPDSAIETTFSETGDPLLEQQDDGNDHNDNEYDNWGDYNSEDDDGDWDDNVYEDDDSDWDDIV